MNTIEDPGAIIWVAIMVAVGIAAFIGALINFIAS
jgi:hypothetical protein